MKKTSKSSSSNVKYAGELHNVASVNVTLRPKHFEGAYPMKSLLVKSSLVGLSVSLLLATGCASNTRVEAVEAKADSAQKTADAAMAAAQRAQQTAEQALKAANDANAAITRMSETVGRK